MRLISLLTSSRAYEFSADAIRLSVLATPSVGTLLQSSFRFQQAGTGFLPATFGPSTVTSPPSTFFQDGILQDPGGREVYLRELYFEQRRVVISVAGPSSLLEEAWTQVCEALRPMTAPDGGPILGVPTDQLEFSEVTVDMDFPPEELFAPGLGTAARSAIKGTSRLAKTTLVPAIHMIVARDSDEYPGDRPDLSIGPRRLWTLSLRAGTSPAERRYYSAAPLDSDTHLRYLGNVERALARTRKRGHTAEAGGRRGTAP